MFSLFLVLILSPVDSVFRELFPLLVLRVLVCLVALHSLKIFAILVSWYFGDFLSPSFCTKLFLCSIALYHWFIYSDRMPLWLMRELDGWEDRSVGKEYLDSGPQLNKFYGVLVYSRVGITVNWVSPARIGLTEITYLPSSVSGSFPLKLSKLTMGAKCCLNEVSTSSA